MNNKFFGTISVVTISSFLLSHALLGMDSPFVAPLDFTPEGVIKERKMLASMGQELFDLIKKRQYNNSENAKKIISSHFPSITQPDFDENFYLLLEIICNCRHFERDEYIRKMMERRWTDLGDATPEDVAYALTQAQLNLFNKINPINLLAFCDDSKCEANAVFHLLTNHDNNLSYLHFIIANAPKKYLPFFVEVAQVLYKLRNSAGLQLTYHVLRLFEDVLVDYITAQHQKIYDEIKALYPGVNTPFNFDVNPTLIQHNILCSRFEKGFLKEMNDDPWRAFDLVSEGIKRARDYKLKADERLVELFSFMPNLANNSITLSLGKLEYCIAHPAPLDRVKLFETWTTSNLINFLLEHQVKPAAIKRFILAGFDEVEHILKFLKPLSKTDAFAVMSALLEAPEPAERLVNYAKQELVLETFFRPRDRNTIESSSSDSGTGTLRQDVTKKVKFEHLKVNPEEKMPAGSPKRRRSRVSSVKVLEENGSPKKLDSMESKSRLKRSSSRTSPRKEYTKSIIAEYTAEPIKVPDLQNESELKPDFEDLTDKLVSGGSVTVKFKTPPKRNWKEIFSEDQSKLDNKEK